MIVTPGIRPANSSTDDQSRITTPGTALLNGSTHLVVGRPITKSASPQQAAADILKEMREAGQC